MKVNFTGRTWRPPYEADSCILPLTWGCAWHKCAFCTLYDGEPFRVVPLSEFERNLEEIKAYQPNARRVFLTGANPFALSYKRLKPYILTVRDYLIKCQTIAMFASVRDIKNKEPWQLRKLRAMGVNGLSIGTESGDDATLSLAGKGYEARDILKQCQKLDEAGIEYYFVYMTGLAGRGNGYRNAVNTARIFNRLNPYFISVDSLTLFFGSRLHRLAGEGKFLPAGEKERLAELQTFIENLQIRTRLLANTKSNFVPLTASLPKERQKIISQLQYWMEAATEEEMAERRKGLDSL